MSRQSSPSSYAPTPAQHNWRTLVAERAAAGVISTLDRTALSPTGNKGVDQLAGITYSESVVVVADVNPVLLCGVAWFSLIWTTKGSLVLILLVAST